MPYIEVKTTIKMSAERKNALAEGLAEVFAKASDSDVAKNIQMVITDECWICFRGDAKKGSAHIQICPGPLTPQEDYAKIVEQFFPVLEEKLGIAKNHIYINVLELEHWGYDGSIVIAERNR